MSSQPPLPYGQTADSPLSSQIVSAQQTNPAGLNQPQRHKPSFGECVKCICYTTAFLGILAFLTFSPWATSIGDYFRNDNFKILDSLKLYYLQKLDSFPLGLSIGIIISPLWLWVKNIWEKFKN